MAAVHAGRRLRELLANEFLILPGVWNGISARLAEQNGFKALYLSGAALTASLGLTDTGICPPSEFCRVIKEMVFVSPLPILADADTGFTQTAQTVKMYNEAGAAGLHIEDQVFPKRCGHLAGKKIINKGEMIKNIKEAKEAAEECSKGEFVICARTDAFAVEGLEKTVQRAKEYAEAGADIIFVEGIDSESAFISFASSFKSALGAPGEGGAPKGAPSSLGGPLPKKGGPPYLLANMTEFGVTPFIKAERFKEMGFNVVVFPVSSFRVALKAMDDLFRELRAKGTVEGLLPQMYTREQLYRLLQYDPSKD